MEKLLSIICFVLAVMGILLAGIAIAADHYTQDQNQKLSDQLKALQTANDARWDNQTKLNALNADLWDKQIQIDTLFENILGIVTT